MEPFRVLLVTQHYKPEPNFITSDIAVALKKLGCDVKVITAQPNYPFGRIYDGYKSFFPRKTLEDGVKVFRLPIFADHSPGKLRRLISYLSFTFGLFFTAPFISCRPHIIVVYQSPFTTALGVAWYKLFGTKIIFLSADLWPESLLGARVGIQTGIYHVMYKYSKWINKFADFIITSTRGMRTRYIEDGFPSARITNIPVWVDGLPSEQTYTESAQPNGQYRITYAGNVGPSQGLDVLIHAAKELENDTRFVFEIYGVGASFDALSQTTRDLQLQNVTFHGRVPPEVAFIKLHDSWASFIHLNRSPYFKHTLPSKLASLLAAGAIIICGAEGELAELVEKKKCGVVFTPDDHKSLSETIRSLARASDETIESMRKAANELYNKEFSPKVLLNRYVETICNEIMLSRKNIRRNFVKQEQPE